MRQILVIVGIFALLFAGSVAVTTSNTGAGTIYKLGVTQDVWLEGSSNKNNYEFIIVAKHPQYEKKRSLLQFESLPTGTSGCSHFRMLSHPLGKDVCILFERTQGQLAVSTDGSLHLPNP